MSETLRDRQKQVGRDLILQAAADEVVEGGLEDLSLQGVADRAGVAKRTLYNYFDSREILLAALRRRSDELTLEMGGTLAPGTLDAMPAMILSLWRIWHAQGTIHQAAMKIEAASSEVGDSAARKSRRVSLAQAVANVRPDLDSRQREELAALVHSLAGAAVYTRLTEEDGLSVDAAANLVAWILTLLHNALANGDDPYTRKQQSR